MDLKSISLRMCGPQTGLSLFDGEDYCATYRSLNECILDLTYRYRIAELDRICEAFKTGPNCSVLEPFVYRGVCSELFIPTDTVFRYVYYKNSLKELFDCFAYHEERAFKHEEIFLYGVQGSGIHKFNAETNKYEFWVGGNVKTVCDVMQYLKQNKMEVPGQVLEEFDRIDVFISHKSQDYAVARPIYDLLTKTKNVFLSEVSIPNIANTDYTATIDHALEKTRGMLVVATNPDVFNSGWVNYEWNSFLNEKRSGRKDGNLVTLVSQPSDIDRLPYALRQFEVVPLAEMASIEQYFK